MGTVERIAVGVLGLLWLAPALLWLRVLLQRRAQLDGGGGVAAVLVRAVGHGLVALLMLACAATGEGVLLGAAAVVLLLQFPVLALLRRRSA